MKCFPLNKKVLDLYLDTYYTVSSNKEVRIISKSRANYFKERRKDTKAFYVEVSKEKMETFEEKLSKQGITKKKWLDEKIDEELKK